jgi:hypothetical protein
MKAEVRDTRDGAGARPRSRIGWPVMGPGEIDELRIFLQDVLQVPSHARRFSVTFTQGEPLVVSVDYVPRETSSTPGDEP